MLDFCQWLAQQAGRPDPIGDLAIDVIVQLEDLTGKNFLDVQNNIKDVAGYGSPALCILGDAQREYETYRKNNNHG